MTKPRLDQHPTAGAHNTVSVPIQRITPTARQTVTDRLAVEEPLAIRLGYNTSNGRTVQNVAITMRTPGHDVELAVGFLFNEGIVSSVDTIASLLHHDPENPQTEQPNTVTVILKPSVSVDRTRLERHFYTTSSCGVCGKASLEALALTRCPQLPTDAPLVHADVLTALPQTLRKTQAVFEQTGGLHAAALFDTAGTLIRAREDVGRHNALDKLIGSLVLERRLPLHDNILLVSGRTSFELTQKALMAEIPILAAVGAPSSLAVDLAQAHGMTLIGFLRGTHMNIYSHAHRVLSASAS